VHETLRIHRYGTLLANVSLLIHGGRHPLGTGVGNVRERRLSQDEVYVKDVLLVVVIRDHRATHASTIIKFG
jgi:hypothetical protein